MRCESQYRFKGAGRKRAVQTGPTFKEKCDRLYEARLRKSTETEDTFTDTFGAERGLFEIPYEPDQKADTRDKQ